MANEPPASDEAQGIGTTRERGRARASAIATDLNSRPFRLWLVIKRRGGDMEIARAVVRHPNVRRRALSAAVRISLRKGHWQVAVAALDNPQCPRRLYGSLAVAPFHAVQAAVAANPRTPREVVEQLLGCLGAWLRLNLATNPSLTEADVDLLLKDRDPYVRCVAAAHHHASGEGLRQLCQGYREPAWTLRAAAANPACPADLSDQILTWLALGGAGDADPRFDPVTCVGHPGSTKVNVAGWYIQAARDDFADTHPLWRVRAAFPSARSSVLIRTLSWLARDPRPEVRRAAARFRGLPFLDLKALAVDDDPTVARLAAASLKAKRAELRKQRPARISRRLTKALPLALLIGLVSFMSHSTPDQNASVLPVPSGSTDLPVFSPDLSLAGGAVTTDALPDGGLIQSGSLSGNGELPFVSVTAGQTSLTLSIPGAFSLGTSLANAPDPVVVEPRSQETLVVPGASSPMSVTVRASNGKVVTVSLSFEGS